MKTRVVASCAACSAGLASAGWFAGLSSWSDCIGCDTDLNDYGTVDFKDLLLVLSAYGTCP